MDPQVFYSCCPSAGLRETAMIAISIPFLTRPTSTINDMKDGNGQGLFDVQRFELVCPACKKTETP